MDLFEKVYNRRWTDEFWDWRFNSKLFGESIRCVMIEDNKVIGNYVGHPLPFKFNDKYDKILFAMNAISDPDHRGKGIFEKLARALYQKAAQMNYKLALGFSNKNASITHFKKLQAVNLGNMPEYKLKIENNDHPSAFPSHEYLISEIDRFDDRTDILWSKNKAVCSYSMIRTKQYLNWRYIDCPEFKWLGYPPSRYYPFIIEKNRIPIAFFVLKKFGNKCHIVDYFGALDDVALESIIRYSITFSIANKLEELSLWSNAVLEKNGISDICQRYAFIRGASESFWTVQLIDPNLESSVIDKEKWFITMGDSDVF